MHSALLIVDLDGPPTANSYRTNLADTLRAPTTWMVEGTTVLGEGSVFFPLAGGMRDFSTAVAACERDNATYKVLFFDKPPTWVGSAKKSR